MGTCGFQGFFFARGGLGSMGLGGTVEERQGWEVWLRWRVLGGEEEEKGEGGLRGFDGLSSFCGPAR